MPFFNMNYFIICLTSDSIIFMFDKHRTIKYNFTNKYLHSIGGIEYTKRDKIYKLFESLDIEHTAIHNLKKC